MLTKVQLEARGEGRRHQCKRCVSPWTGRPGELDLLTQGVEEV